MIFIAAFTYDITANVQKWIIPLIVCLHCPAIVEVLTHTLGCDQDNDGAHQCTLIFSFIQVCPHHLEALNSQQSSFPLIKRI